MFRAPADFQVAEILRDAGGTERLGRMRQSGMVLAAVMLFGFVAGVADGMPPPPTEHGPHKTAAECREDRNDCQAVNLALYSLCMFGAGNDPHHDTSSCDPLMGSDMLMCQVDYSNCLLLSGI